MAIQQANLTSTAIKKASRKGNIAITNIANDNKIKLECNIEQFIQDTGMDEHGQLNEEDLKELQNQGEKMVIGKKNKNSEARYKHYQNLWWDYICHKNIKDEIDYICLMAFFYARSTLWVIHSCINSYTIDNFGANLKNWYVLQNTLRLRHCTMLQKNPIILS